jgi:capsular polysaccharide biosynthesis protein
MSEDLERKQQAERFQVLDAARTPEKPIKPKRLPIFAGVVVFALLVSCGTVIAMDILKGAVKSEAELKTMLPPKVPVLGTIPPIASEADQRQARLVALRTALVSAVACIAFLLFLLRVKPIL